jgi:hemin uptake protein HemP
MTGPKMPTQPDRQPATEERPVSVPTVSSKQLLQGGRELRIIHDGQMYRLQVTRNNKLILQK